jgi:hypothetical protein
VRRQLANDQATVAVQATGYALKRFGWRHGQRKFDVHRVPESSIIGTIRSDTGVPRQELYVSLKGPDGMSHWHQLDKDSLGQFRFIGLSGGGYRLAVRDERRQLLTDDHHVRAGQTLNLELTVSRLWESEFGKNESNGRADSRGH